VKIISSGKTDVGLRRSNNEDAYCAIPDSVFYAVSDGMGGAAAGEIASRIFIEAAQEVFSRCPSSEQEIYMFVQEIFQLGNERIIEHATEHPDHKGMGCTAELIGFYGDRYIIGHIGDSRTYHFRDGVLRQITKDHSLVQDQLDQGLISPEDARRHPLRHIVHRALGIGTSVSLDIIRGKVQQQDIFLLCTDGLTDLLDDSRISAILNSGNDVHHCADQLIGAAIAAGGKDNVTVVLCEII
jgi:protein phosphatase